MDYGYEVNVWIMVMKWMDGLWICSESMDNGNEVEVQIMYMKFMYRLYI